MTSLSCTKPSLSTESLPSSGGSITPSNGSYDNGVDVTVTASAAPGYRFDHWEGSASGTTPKITITMKGIKKVIAYFKKIYTLAVSATPNGGGTVSPSKGSYDEGQSVTLIAMPSQYYAFNGWAGDASGSSDHLAVTMDSNKNIIASFVKRKVSLNTSIGSTGGGTIEPSSGDYDAQTTIKVTAIPAQGYRFNKWEGSVTSTTNSLNLLMDTNKTLTAFFTRVFTLNSSANLNGGGVITTQPSSESIDQSATVNLSATANFPNVFDHWTGTDSDNNNPTSAVMNGDKSVTAYFRPLTASPQQIKTGVYNGFDIQIPIQLNVDQWVEIGISSTQYNIPVRFLDPNSKVLKDFGWTTTGSLTLQAQTNGTYTVDIIGSSTLFNPSYRVTYTMWK